MQTPDILEQFSNTLKPYSISMDRESLVKLFESVIELCTQMSKAKLKAAVKAATTKDTAAAKKAPAAKKTPAAKKAQPTTLAVETIEPGAAEDGVCPLETDIAKPMARGRGRPRKSATTVVEVAAPAGGEKKRGRPKKDKSVVMTSNDDEDALIAQMITDAKNTKINDDLNEETESDCSTVSVSPAPTHHHESESSETLLPVEKDVQDVQDGHDQMQCTKQETKAVKAKAVRSKAVKEPNEPKAAKTVKEPKAAKAVKEPKEPKAAKAVKEPKANESKATAAQATAAQATAAQATAAQATAAQATVSAINIVASATSAAPVRENKAHSDGKFYLMPNYPRSSFTYSGKTYLRTENDNVYDNLTLELIGVWDHLNHEIITSFDDDDELWMSDEE